jgi:hypothetical protein
MEQQNEKGAWEAMDVEEAGRVGEVLQGPVKFSPIQKGFDEDLAEG